MYGQALSVQFLFTLFYYIFGGLFYIVIFIVDSDSLYRMLCPYKRPLMVTQVVESGPIAGVMLGEYCVWWLIVMSYIIYALLLCDRWNLSDGTSL